MGSLDTAVLVDTMAAATKAPSAYAIARLECGSWSDRIHHAAQRALAGVVEHEPTTDGLAELQTIENGCPQMANEAPRCDPSSSRGSGRRAWDETMAPMRCLRIVAL
jgi:hypothetical protein